MNLTYIEKRLRELLVDVLGYDSIDDINPEASLVTDLGAESLDFVETLWLIEDNFGVVLKANEVIAGNIAETSADLFVDDRLTGAGAEALRKRYPHRAERIDPGLTKVALFQMITVHDLAVVVASKVEELAEVGQGG